MTPPPARAGRPGPGLAAAILLLALSLLPIARWLPGGWDIPWYPERVAEWASGTAIVVGAGVVLAILSRRLPALWRDGLLRAPLGWIAVHPRGATAVLVALAAAAYLLVARLVFSGRPLLIDEIVQVLQAQVFAEGRLWRPSPGLPEFFGAMHLVDVGGRLYGQFPPGGPALLLPGVLAGAPWVVVPLLGAAAVAAWCWFLGAAEPRPGVRAGAALLFAAAPFALFMFGSHMNHGMALACLTVTLGALANGLARPEPRPALALVAGLGLGAAATIRPVDALAFALPAGLWFLLAAARDRRRMPELLAAGLGVVLPLVPMLVVNARTTGSPFLFGYEVLWGADHGLGFHRAPWGDVHTPARGLELVNLYLLRLQAYLFESPLPSLLPAAAALALAPAFTAMDRYLLAAGGLLLGVYFAYWHDGFYLGPRFVFPLLPVLVLWTARLPALVRERWGDGMAWRATAYGAAVAAALALLVGLPTRAREYANGLLTMRWDAEGAAEAAGVREALVLVRESWGSQVIARLWGAGVSRSAAEALYRGIDTCVLDRALARLEAAGTRGGAAEAALRPLLADSARTVRTTLSPDITERMLPGATYPAACVARLEEDRQGFTLLPPLLLARRGANVYARDLHARDTLLLSRYPDRPVFLLQPDGYRTGAVPRFIPLSRDSLLASWRRGGAS